VQRHGQVVHALVNTIDPKLVAATYADMCRRSRDFTGSSHPHRHTGQNRQHRADQRPLEPHRRRTTRATPADRPTHPGRGQHRRPGLGTPVAVAAECAGVSYRIGNPGQPGACRTRP
jgi:hypothetical protein